MTQNECFSNLIAPGAARKGGAFGPCPLLNGSSAVPWRQSSGVFPTDPDAVDMLHVDDFYDASAAGFVREAHAARSPFFFYFASHHTHAPQFAECQAAGTYFPPNCTTPRGLFGDSLALLDRSVGRMHALIAQLGIEGQTLTIYTADNGGSLQWGNLGGTNGDLRCGKGTLWEGGVRVPAIVRWPGVVAPGGGRARPHVVSRLDAHAREPRGVLARPGRGVRRLGHVPPALHRRGATGRRGPARPLLLSLVGGRERFPRRRERRVTAV